MGMSLPAIEYWVHEPSLFTAGSFALFAALGFAGIAAMTEAHRKMIYLGYGVAVVLFFLGWWQTAVQEEKSDLQNQEYSTLVGSLKKVLDLGAGQQSLSAIVTALKTAQQQVADQEQAKAAVARIIGQYDSLQNGITTFEQISGTQDLKERLAAANHIIDELKIELGAIQFNNTPQGQALIVKIAPNTFRVTFPVPMRATPAINFPGLPHGVTPHVTEESNLGFTVMFTPLTIPIERLGP